MIYPPDLRPGDKVMILSPAGKVDRRVVERGAELLRQQGFKVRIGRSAFKEAGVFAGPDSDRAADMQKALDDPSIKAVFFSRGGYGCLRTHLRLDWSAFLARPKWLVGFSDVTVFHAYLARQRIASLHAVMPSMFERDGVLTDGFQQMMEVLSGRKSDCKVPPHELNRTGKAVGRLTGGNLSIIMSLRGTTLDLRPKGKILFIEDVGEYRYHLDRILGNLEAGGVLDGISGLLVGHFTEMKEGGTPFGGSTEEIIRKAVDPYGYPLAFGFPAGHELPNRPLMMGSKVTLKVGEDGVSLRCRKL